MKSLLEKQIQTTTFPALYYCELPSAITHDDLRTEVGSVIDNIVKSKQYTLTHKAPHKHNFYFRWTANQTLDNYLEAWFPMDAYPKEFLTFSWKQTIPCYSKKKPSQNIKCGGISFLLDENDLIIQTEFVENGYAKDSTQSDDVKHYLKLFQNKLNFNINTVFNNFEQYITILTTLKG